MFLLEYFQDPTGCMIFVLKIPETFLRALARTPYKVQFIFSSHAVNLGWENDKQNHFPLRKRWCILSLIAHYIAYLFNELSGLYCSVFILCLSSLITGTIILCCRFCQIRHVKYSISKCISPFTLIAGGSVLLGCINFLSGIIDSTPKFASAAVTWCICADLTPIVPIYTGWELGPFFSSVTQFLICWKWTAVVLFFHSSVIVCLAPKVLREGCCLTCYNF